MTIGANDLAIWPAAVNAALLGADRTSLTLPAPDGTLGAACAGLTRDEPDPATLLLRVAAAATVYRRCGWRPARMADPAPETCPPDPRPLCSPGAVGLLRRILRGEHESLLGEWLALAARHGVRAPSDALRDLLDLGRREPGLRSLILAAGGTRATWLAGFNDEWSYAIAGASLDALVATFETGPGPARLAALRQLRLVDAERARAELEKSWAQESPADRAGFVAAFVHGLTPEDEPFLERALDDRRKEVRQQAAALLTRLPTSALVGRMVERATGLLSLGRTSMLKRTRIEVGLPAAADAVLVRDGVEAKPPAGIGERAWWLAQIIAAVPPATWTAAWSLAPNAVLRAADDNEWREPVVAGWLSATERHRDAAWAAALWENERMARVDPRWGAPPPERVFTSVASAEQIDTMLRSAIGAGRDVLRGSHPALAAILEWPEQWSDALAGAVARRLKEYAGVDRVPLTAEFGLRALLERCAHAVPVPAVGAFLEGWPAHVDVWPTWAPTIDSLTSVLRFRSDLHRAFDE